MSAENRIRKASLREQAALENAAQKHAGNAFGELVRAGDDRDPPHQRAMFVLDVIIARAPQEDHQNFNIATGGHFGDHDPAPFDLYDAVDKSFAGILTPHSTSGLSERGDLDDIPI